MAQNLQNSINQNTSSFTVIVQSTLPYLTAAGSNSSTLVTTGPFNTAYGANTLSANVTGGSNTALGYNTLFVNTASFSTAVGTGALQAITTGGTNTAVGYRAGSSYTGLESNNILVGANVLGALGESNTLRIGATATMTTAYIAGVNEPISGFANSIVLVDAHDQLGSVALTNGQLLIGATGLSPVAATLTGGTNIVVTNSAGGITISTTGSGASAAIITTPTTTAVGLQALTSAINAGATNTAIGYQALMDNTTGSLNTAVGTDALQLNVEGNQNTAVGYHALSALTTGNNNVALGYDAGLSYTGAESNDITIGANVIGTAGESNVIRLGTAINATYISGIYGTISANANEPVTIDSNGHLGSIALTNGQLLIGSTGASPVASVLTQGDGIVITNGAGSITIATSPDITKEYIITTPTTTAVGLQALTSAINAGATNTAMGYQALMDNTTGSLNTAVGTDALQLNVEGNQNTAVGYQALSALTTGNNNVAIGYDAGLSYTGAESNDITIGANVIGTTGESNVIRLGTAINATYISGIYGTISANANQPVVIDSNGHLGSIALTNGQLLIGSTGASPVAATLTGGTNIVVTNSAGGITISTTGSGASAAIITTPTTTAVGLQALTSAINAGATNTAMGYQALMDNTTGSLNTAVGTDALQLNVQGNQNTAVGYHALSALTTGNNNVALGYDAGLSYTNAESNDITIGANVIGTAGESNVIRLGTAINATYISGIYGTISANANQPVVIDSNGHLGSIALTNGQLLIGSTGASPVASVLTQGDGIVITNGAGSITIATSPDITKEYIITTPTTTAVGLQALTSAINAGATNTAMGYQALMDNTTGSLNTAVGTDALQLNVQGNQNTAVGYQALSALTTGNNNVAIGYDAGLSYTGAESNDITIGANVIGTAGESNIIRLGTAINATYISGIYGTISANANQPVVIDSNGHLGSIALTNGQLLIGATGLSPVAATLTGGTNIVVTNSAGGITISTSGSGASAAIITTPTTTAVGLQALTSAINAGATNTAMGYQALMDNTTGSLNTAVGTDALQLNVQGNQNTAVGYHALSALTTGNNNVAIGYDAGLSYTGAESNDITIGANVIGTAGESNIIRLGTAINATYISGIYGTISANANQPVVIDSNGHLGSIALTNGELLIGSTGASPVAATLTQGLGITITNGAGSITIASAFSGITWQDVSANTPMTADTGYTMVAASSTIDFTLPSSAAYGTMLWIAGGTASTPWALGQNAGQQIIFGGTYTSVGTTGTISSTSGGDTLQLLCTKANTLFNVLSGVGNMSIN